MVNIGPIFRVSLRLFMTTSGHTRPCPVWLLFEGRLLGPFFENLLTLVDEFEPCFVVFEWEGEVERVWFVVGRGKWVSAIIMRHIV